MMRISSVSLSLGHVAVKALQISPMLSVSQSLPHVAVKALQISPMLSAKALQKQQMLSGKVLQTQLMLTVKVLQTQLMLTVKVLQTQPLLTVKVRQKQPLLSVSHKVVVVCLLAYPTGADAQWYTSAASSDLTLKHGAQHWKLQSSMRYRDTQDQREKLRQQE